MNPQLFDLYRQELQHLRDMGGEFAAEFPKVAGRLGLETLECSDPYVERLLEGFAFLAARVQLKIESSQGQLARQLLEQVQPNSLSPTPSMVIAELFPSLSEGSLAQGFRLPRGTRLRSQVAPEEKTECDFRTAHALTLWPVTLTRMRYLGSPAALEAAGVHPGADTRSGLALQLQAVSGHVFSELPLDDLSIHLTGTDSAGSRLHEQLFRHTRAIDVVSEGQAVRRPSAPVGLQPQGFADDEALLPVTHRGFKGYRLVQEYFAFPERFLFARLGGLHTRLKRCHGNTIELVFQFDNHHERLFDTLDESNFRLNCVPAINLFPKTADRIVLDRGRHRFHVVPDRTRPLDHEVHSVTAVTGYAGSQMEKQLFTPYFASHDGQGDVHRHYTLEREPRRLSSRQKRSGTRSSYVGSEVFLSLVDMNEAPYRSDLKQLGVETLCTNRDLPLQMPVGRKQTDFQLDIGAPVERIRCLQGPTVPGNSRGHQRDAWYLISNLVFNHLSLDSRPNDDGQAAAAMLRQMLSVFIDPSSNADSRLLEGILSVRSEPVVHQVRHRSHLEIVRGLSVTIRVDETAFEGSGAYLFGTVIEHFLARHATINSFTETVLESVQRNEIQRWPVMIGQRSTL